MKSKQKQFIFAAFIFLLLLAPSFAEAMVSSAPNQQAGTVLTWTLTEKTPNEKHKLLDRVTKKLWQKRLNKTLFRHRDFDGKGLAVAGLVIGVIGLIPYIIGLEIGFFFSIPLALWGLIGLVFSIPAFILARGWDGNDTIKWIAISGMIINGLLVLSGITFLVLLGTGYEPI
jgi:hypothetical protein